MELFRIPNFDDVRHRLRYNIAPLDAERPAIRDSIRAAQLRLAEIQDSAEHDNVSEAVALSQYISDSSSLLAPIRLLSVEILQIIFVHPDIHSSLNIGSDAVTIYGPEVIGKVSYHWREVARVTPELWSSFQVKLKDGRYSDLEQIRLRLERSKSVPLTISFDWEESDSESTQSSHVQAVGEIVAEFLLHVERWAHVTLFVDWEFLSHLSSARGRLPLLEAVGFRGKLDGNSKELKIFKDVPKLRSLSLDRHATTAHLPPLPWSQLKRISAPLANNVIGEILELASSLRKFTVFSDAEFYQSINPVRSPGIREIVLLGSQGHGRVCIVDALTSMNTPELKKITVVQSWKWNSSDSQSIRAFLQRSGCSLQTLVLRGCHVRAPHLIALFPAMPTLGTLVLADNIPTTVTDTVLDALTMPAREGGILPTLHTLVLKGSYVFSTSNLLAMLESRIGSQPSLANIDISLSHRKISPLELNRLAAIPKVLSEYLAPSWFIFTVPRWRRYTQY
ncbi:hypothetical protein K438DRAFT_1835664 [Mycena galopus ATCC 62051]|nr:hypothetical protein K438DRAFT_1835664 [Mycena galopus ATCC 62051]